MEGRETVKPRERESGEGGSEGEERGKVFNGKLTLFSPSINYNKQL